MSPRASRITLGFLALTFVPAILVIDLAVALARGWQSSSNMPDAIFGLFGSMVAAGVLLLAAPKGRTFLARKAVPLTALAVAGCLAWGMAEVVCSTVFGGQLLFHRHVPGTTVTFHPSPEIMPGVADDAVYTANSLGLRGDEFPANDAYRILCVGGSTTACLFLDDTETWTRLLQEELDDTYPEGVWVGDAGKSGYGSWQHVQFLTSGSLLGQVDCVVFLVGINDFSRALQGRPIRVPFGVKPLYERSAVFALLHNWYQVSKQRREYMLENVDGSTYVKRRELRAQCDEVAELPTIDASLDEYVANLRVMAEVPRAAGLRVVFATQPVLWHEDLPASAERLLWLGLLGDGERLAVPALAAGMRRFNDALRRVARESGAEVVELSSMDGNVEFFFDDCHFSELGSRRVAELIASHFRATPR